MTKLRSKAEIEAGLAKLKHEYDEYCRVASQQMPDLAERLDAVIGEALGRTVHVARRAIAYAERETSTEYRAKIKALWWALGEEEL